MRSEMMRLDEEGELHLRPHPWCRCSDYHQYDEHEFDWFQLECCLVFERIQRVAPDYRLVLMFVQALELGSYVTQEQVETDP